MTKTATTVKSPSRKPRKSPLQQAIAAADKAVTRAHSRKERGFKRIAKLEAKIAVISGSSGQFDALIQQLQANAETLRKLAATVG